MVTCRVCGSLIASLSLTISSADAQTLVSSRFDAGDENWALVNWNGDGAPVAPSWNAAGGNPGGYLRSSDVHGDGFWRAPATFRGDWSAAYGGSLKFDAFTSYSNWEMNDVFITGSNGVTLSYWFHTNPPPTWKTYEVRLDATAGWQVGLNYDREGPPATLAQIISVLTNVAELRIREEYVVGSDDSALDNVVLLAGSAVMPPVFAAPSVQAGEIVLTLHFLRANRTYQIEQTSSLSQGTAWQPIRTFIATASAQALSIPATNAPIFFRAVVP